MKKRYAIALSSVFLAFFFSTGVLSACEMSDKKDCQVSSDKKCKMSSSDCSKDKDCDKKMGECPIVSKFMKKAHFFLANKEEIGLSVEQVSIIKNMVVQMKKSMIRMGAEMQVFELDMENKLSEPKTDVEGLNKMIDEAMAGMAVSGKSTVKSLADLKAILTDDQMAKAKEIWMKKK